MKEQDHLDELGLEAWEAFVFAHAAAVGRIERDLGRDGALSLAWYDVLVALANAPGRRLRLNELAGQVVLSRSGLTRLLDRIEQAGLIRRKPVPGDRRGAFAVLTPEGARAQQETWPSYAAGIARHFADHLSDDEKRVLARALRRVREGTVPRALEPAPLGHDGRRQPDAPVRESPAENEHRRKDSPPS